MVKSATGPGPAGRTRSSTPIDRSNQTIDARSPRQSLPTQLRASSRLVPDAKSGRALFGWAATASPASRPPGFTSNAGPQSIPVHERPARTVVPDHSCGSYQPGAGLPLRPFASAELSQRCSIKNGETYLTSSQKPGSPVKRRLIAACQLSRYRGPAKRPCLHVSVCSLLLRSSQAIPSQALRRMVVESVGATRSQPFHRRCMSSCYYGLLIMETTARPRFSERPSARPCGFRRKNRIFRRRGRSPDDSSSGRALLHGVGPQAEIGQAIGRMPCCRQDRCMAERPAVIPRSCGRGRPVRRGPLWPGPALERPGHDNPAADLIGHMGRGRRVQPPALQGTRAPIRPSRCALSRDSAGG